MNKDDINEARRMLNDLLRSAYDRHLYDNYNGNVEIVFTKKDTYMHYQWLDAALNRLESLEVALNKACEHVGDFTGSCPLDTFDVYIDCDNCDNQYVECWKKYYLKGNGSTDSNDESAIKVPLD